MTYKLVLEDGKLFFQHRNAPEQPLEPTLPDQFRVRAINVEFQRDAENAISGFTVNAGRVRNILFQRKTP